MAGGSDILKPVYPHQKKVQRGESLIEVIIAIGMLMLIGGPASALFLSSIRTLSINRNELLASSLADEGVEMLRNMRDTNLLRFSSKKAECWNVMPEVREVATCQEPQQSRIAGSFNDFNEHFYRLAVRVNPQEADYLEWRLEAQPPMHDSLVAADEPYRLQLDEDPRPACVPPNLLDCHTDFVDDTHLYTHDARRGHATPLHREVMTKNIDLDGDLVADAFMVRVRVGYVDGSHTRFVTRSTVLTSRE